MHSPKPRISVGVPVYNAEKLLGETLDCLLEQTYADFEIVISDNASTDGTEALCREYAARDPRVRYERADVNRGPAWNFNRVFELSRGELFKWAAHDDLCAPTYLEKCVGLLDEHADAILAHTRTAVIDETNQVVADDGAGFPRGARRAGAPLLHDHAARRRLDSPSPARRMADVLLRSERCYEIFGLMRAAELADTLRHGEYCGAEKVLLVELALRGRFVESPETLFCSRWHDDRFSSHTATADQNAHFHPTTPRGPTSKRAIPRQVRCTAGYLHRAWTARLTPWQRLACLGVFAQYLFQVNKWAVVAKNSWLGRDVSAVIPPGAERASPPDWLERLGSRRPRSRAAVAEFEVEAASAPTT